MILWVCNRLRDWLIMRVGRCLDGYWREERRSSFESVCFARESLNLFRLWESEVMRWDFRGQSIIIFFLIEHIWNVK